MAWGDLFPVFTGAGINSNGYPVSYQWLGISSVLPAGGNYNVPYTSIVNGEINIKESTGLVTFQTTAFNGFAGSYPECAVISGSVRGFIVPSYSQPSPVLLTQPNSSRLWWMKVVSGSMLYEGPFLINDLDCKSTVTEEVAVTFGFQLCGIPRAAQFNFLAGGVQP